MSRELLNTLFVTTQGAYVHTEGDTVRVEVDKSLLLQVPLHHLGGIVVFGNVMMSPHAMMRCATEGRTVTFLDYNGRYLGRVAGPTSGNVLLREAQYSAHADTKTKADVARSIVAGKLHNLRGVLQRGSRETDDERSAACLRDTASAIGNIISGLRDVTDIDEIRGYEGQASSDYFGVFADMIFAQRADFRFSGRNRRPPRDRVNALLSFLYALLANDCGAAAEGVGLDPQIGYLHASRSGRPALALDLMEEFRPILADRLALNLINKRQLGPSDFDERPGGSVLLNEKGRKTVLVAYQKRKQTEVGYTLLKSKIPLGLAPHLQARVLARRLRGEAAVYLPYIPR
jgi:CRISPR-associated protein Cas1